MAKIRVHLGGLALMVQRELNDPGLYVLMAYDHHSPTGPLHHKAIVQDLTGSIPGDTSIEGMEIDLRPMLRGGTVRQKLTGALPTNKICKGKVSVPLLTGSVARPITARVILPLPTTPPKLQDTVDVSAHVDGTTTIYPDLAGLLSFEYDVVAPIEIKGKRYPGEIRFGNVIDERRPKPHGKGEPMPHAEMHFNLVKGCAHKFPTLFSAEDYPSPGKLLPTDINQAKWSDPVVCTIGYGCPEDEPDCGEG